MGNKSLDEAKKILGTVEYINLSAIREEMSIIEGASEGVHGCTPIPVMQSIPMSVKSGVSFAVSSTIDEEGETPVAANGDREEEPIGKKQSSVPLLELPARLT